VGVPDWIQQKNEYRIACLRGLMDTDGGVFIHKYKVNNKYYSYRKICFTNRSVPLLRFVYDTLKELGLTAKIVDKVENKKVWLYNTHEVASYLAIVKSSNWRLNRYQL
ncbi:MAG: LAGLIDADG family homing endonuclease, partial [Candidatus Woesebacteria bacterium]|nr:LAGLIDADG family homing endonuclease [Candidatus Woesebacteria bacterium]